MTDGDAVPDDDLVALPGTNWMLWRQAELRTAGLPAALASALSDEQVHAAATSAVAGSTPTDTYQKAFTATESIRSAVITNVAAEPLLREAVAWQGAGMLSRCVDKLAGDATGKPSVRRKRELKLAAYLQRYTLKNDTIGFFGPVGFARLVDDGPAVTLKHGSGLVTTRNVHFEQWAIGALAAAIAVLPGVRPWLTPRRASDHHIENGLVVRSQGPNVALDYRASQVLHLCDGYTPVHRITDLCGEPVDDVLDWLLANELIVTGLEPPHSDMPELGLLRSLQCIDDPLVRKNALAVLNHILAARDAVAAAAGDADALLTALVDLDTRFEEATGTNARRKHGMSYAGRGVVYEDTVRDMDVALGPQLLGGLAGPLGIVLDSARWFVGQIGEAYKARATAVFDALRDQLGAEHVPFHRLLAALTPDLVATHGAQPEPVASAVSALHERWSVLLQVPEGVRTHLLSTADIRDRARALFPVGPLPWSSAVHHCPDIMIAATDVDTICRGDAQFVLGELHVAMNTLDCRVISAQHPKPSTLLARDKADRHTRRALPVPAKDSPSVNSRTYPPVLVDADQFFWTAHSRNTGAPGRIVPAVAMTVLRTGDTLFVDADGERVELLEVLGEYLSAAAVSAFSFLATTTHRPRLVLDDLVIAREAWRLRADELAWAAVSNRAERFRQVTAWRLALALPRRVFYRVAVENKPLYVDFASPVLVDLFASIVRRTIDDDRDADVWLTEMLPDVGEQWVRDAQGASYSAELRVVAVDRAAPSGHDNQ